MKAWIKTFFYSLYKTQSKLYKLLNRSFFRALFIDSFWMVQLSSLIYDLMARVVSLGPGQSFILLAYGVIIQSSFYDLLRDYSNPLLGLWREDSVQFLLELLY